MTWTKVGQGKYRTEYCGHVWLLKATPKDNKPWLLYTEQKATGYRSTRQEIGAHDQAAAMHAADFWLCTSVSYGLAGY
nr:hypothetical protein [Kibdelosporangium sp. MJ126-NF4]CEL15075.1 hypothetical protein [Kibdelosporangium sp. MJ126-NF4]CTQ93329.1 hypothetical protein [Kibdelosporangium sp. MJ126-NF4]